MTLKASRPSGLPDEAREVETDFTFAGLECDPDDLGRARFAADIEQLFETRDPVLTVLGLTAPPLRDGDGHVDVAHRPRIPASTLRTRARAFSSSVFRTAPYSAAGTGSRKEAEPVRGTRTRTMSGVSKKAIRPI